MSSHAKIVVAIDGPAGAGKSTVAKLVASRLGLPMLDTGAMYRCTALAAVRSGMDLTDGAALGDLARACDISFEPGEPQKVLLNGEDVTGLIRTPEVSQASSQISAHSPVRRVLVERQKEFVSGGGFVLEGRDTTTVVAPQAEVKVFLTASAEERARRRWLELKQKGGGLTLQEVVLDVVERDHRDYTRADSPLCLSEEAVIVETFGMTPSEVADKIVSLAG